MSTRTTGGRRGPARWLAPGFATIVTTLSIATFGVAVAAPPAGAATSTYSAIETIPVPPASAYAGSGSGDGWAVALSNTAVYNVFHHSTSLTVACHLQSNAAPCWTPRTITATTGSGFATASQPGLHFDQATGDLYVFATRTSDQTGGVVCIDTNAAATSTDPYCGFTALTPVGGAPLATFGISGISDPALVGSSWYAFNYAHGSGVTGAENELLCFDLATSAPCPSQPFSVGIGTGTVEDYLFPGPAVSLIGTEIVVPATVTGADGLFCFDGSSGSPCAGAWPVTLSTHYDTYAGAAFPLLTSTGVVSGLCLPWATDPCYSLSGTPVSTPANMSTVILQGTGWNGPAFVLGPRVYVPNGNDEQVQCYDYSVDAACANFPKQLTNLYYLYTVNPDPQRPTCIWVNADSGTDQIQNFDAYTGGPCGQGPIRVLASSLVVPTTACTPTTYTSLQVLKPPRATYTSGTVAFENTDAGPIPGITPMPLDTTGSVDLSGLDLNTALGLPQFLITLNGTSSVPSTVQVELTWTGAADPVCGPQPSQGVGPVAGFGDSIAAGYGLSQAAEWNSTYLANRFPTGDASCSLTPKAYPCVLAQQSTGTQATSENFAVQGAASTQVLSDELTAAAGQSAAWRTSVKTVTLTVGANDIDFSGCLSDEFQFKTDHCLAGTINNLKVSKSTGVHLSHLSKNLHTIFDQAHSLFPNATIDVTGYFQPFPGPAPTVTNVCPLFDVPALAAIQTQQGIGLAAILTYLHNLPQFASEFQTRFYRVATFLAGQLDQTIQNAATAADTAGLPVTYVSLATTFSGHDICQQGTSWVFAPRLIADIGAVITIDSSFGTPHCTFPAPAVVGSEIQKTIFHGSLGFAIFYSNCIPHPLPAGQQAIAQAIGSG